MKLEAFVSYHRLRQKRDECGDLNAIGKRGSIYEHSPGIFAATIVGPQTAHYWNAQRAALKAAGCRITQNGDSEGTAVFDPGNSEQVKAALMAIRAFRRRIPSPETLARLAEMRSRMAKLEATT